MPDRPIVLIHGYSDTSHGFEQWRSTIEDWGVPVKSIFVGNYVSLNNEITIKDIAEGFDRALVRQAELSADDEFDAIVHSTGMLVIRAWLNSYAEGEHRRSRLKHLIALAPATNGSPLAHKGRSWLGSIFKGNREIGPDFMEAGNEILYGLELGSDFTWKLAHDDLIDDNARFREGPDTPYVFTFCGNRNYGFLQNLFSEEDGTDGTVRWAGCPLNSRKVTVDLMVAPGSDRQAQTTISTWANQDNALVFIDRVNHSTIMSRPPRVLQDLVRSALEVETAEEFSEWNEKAQKQTRDARRKLKRWQQFVIRVVDERGDPVTDWNAQLYGHANAKEPLRQFDLSVHVFRRDPSYRCFHVDLDELKPGELKQLHLRLIANSGTKLVAYHGAGSERVSADGTKMNPEGLWDARVSLTNALGKQDDFQLFHPFTTTFVQICLNREPMPMIGKNSVYWFVE